MTGLDAGDCCGDDLGSALDRCDPATVRGWMRWFAVWVGLSLTNLIRLRKPPSFNPRRTVLYPCRSGGVDFRLGSSLGGPQIFGGAQDENHSCRSPGWQKIRTVVRNGKVRRETWTPRRPSEYRVETRRFRTSGVLAALRE